MGSLVMVGILKEARVAAILVKDKKKSGRGRWGMGVVVGGRREPTKEKGRAGMSLTRLKRRGDLTFFGASGALESGSSFGASDPSSRSKDQVPKG